MQTIVTAGGRQRRGQESDRRTAVGDIQIQLRITCRHPPTGFAVDLHRATTVGNLDLHPNVPQRGDHDFGVFAAKSTRKCRLAGREGGADQSAICQAFTARWPNRTADRAAGRDLNLGIVRHDAGIRPARGSEFLNGVEDEFFKPRRFLDRAPSAAQ